MKRALLGAFALIFASGSALASSEITSVLEDASNDVVIRDFLRLEETGSFAAVINDYVRSPFAAFSDVMLDNCKRGTCVRRLRDGGELAKLRMACGAIQRVGEIVYMGRHKEKYVYECSRNAYVVEAATPADHASYTFFDRDMAMRAVCEYEPRLGRGRALPDVNISTRATRICVAQRVGSRGTRSVRIDIRTGDYLVTNGDCSRE